MYFITMPLLSQRTRPDREDVSFPIPVFIPVYWTRDRTSRAMSGEGASFPYLVFNPPYWTRDRTSRAMSGEGASSPPHDIQKRLQHLGRVVVSPGGVVISPGGVGLPIPGGAVFVSLGRVVSANVRSPIGRAFSQYVFTCGSDP